MKYQEEKEDRKRTEAKPEVQSTGYRKENGSSVVGRSVQLSADPRDGAEDTFDEASVGKSQNGWMRSGADYNHECNFITSLESTGRT
jgi:hypothetical protein